MKIAAKRRVEATAATPSLGIASLGTYTLVPELSRKPNLLGSAIVQGENGAVLEGLASVLRGRVRCVYIDPPYNNNESYTHYNDRWSHERWLHDIRSRINLLHPLLSESGTIWVSIDDAEVHYVRLALEETFGRENFLSTFVWQHRKSRENRKVFSNNHEYVLCFAKNAQVFKTCRNLLRSTSDIDARYRNPDNDPRGPWQSISANVQAGHAVASQFYTIISPSGTKFDPPKGRCWAYNKIRMDREIAEGNIYFGRNGSGSPRIKKFLKDAKVGVVPNTLWGADEVGTTNSAKRHLMSILKEEEVFDTPKPEGLIQRILEIATNPGDLVLDAYLGSGTTASVAHKMDRSYIGIEQGQHALTHCAARLAAVVEGEQGGVSVDLGWDGGGGFDVYVAR